MFISDKDKLFCSKLDDAVELCLTRQKPYFFSFMSERKQLVAKNYLKSVCFENYAFFGGYENSERKVLGLFFDEPAENDFPVSPIVFKFRKCDKLSHRDFLGALMSLGIEREAVGDILIEDGKCVVFVKTELENYITSQIFKIGNVGVSFDTYNPSSLPCGRGVEEDTYIVSSLRLDNVVAAVTGLSRDKTKTLILSGCVSVNFIPTQNVSQIINIDTTLIIRGRGKYILNDITGKTKKDRIRISVLHYR